MSDKRKGYAHDASDKKLDQAAAAAAATDPRTISDTDSHTTRKPS